MKPKEKIDTDETIKPQQSLEMILQLEIEIAEKITAAKDKAEEKITAAQNNTANLKNHIVESARSERDRAITEGIGKAHTTADERVKKAAEEARQFVAAGKEYEQEAVEYVMQLIVGSSNQREEK
jgi:vacuolar-type H+-ATPase subunit H